MKKAFILVIIIIVIIVVVMKWSKTEKKEIAVESQSQTQEPTQEEKEVLAEAAVTGKDEDGAERVRSVRKLRIGASLEKCESEKRSECMVVNGQSFDGDIEGFDYEEGFLYEINAEAVPIEEEGVSPQNQRLQYYFVEELSKMTEKEAEEKAAAEEADDEGEGIDPEVSEEV